MKKTGDSKRSNQDKRIEKYQPASIEKKWQETWENADSYRFVLDEKKEPYYTLVELPYPSGDLHLGHWYTFVPPDAHARYQRMSGKNVFFPNGFDAFGLPAENAAIKRHIHPQDWTMQNIQTMRSQFASMGTMIDWSHQAITCLPEYYRWNQWIFIKMFEKGVAYRGEMLSNWCPVDQTVLANEHVEAGKCWRCGTEVVQKEIEQWFLKITAYADALLWPSLDTQGRSNGVDWPQSVRDGQNSWIGKSEGALIKFPLPSANTTIDVYSTRPDTLFGATFLVLAPEHPVVAELLSGAYAVSSHDKEAVREYVATAKKKSELERKESKEKTGVATGLYARHPLTDKELPVFVADYVLWGYGTGAIMAVPAHDERDHAFAVTYHLPIVQVISGNGGESTPSDAPYLGDGVLINSGSFNGQEISTAKKSITEYLQNRSLGQPYSQYHLHDWSISRQRYWGTPVPMIHCDDCGIVPVPYEDLPVTLPYEVDYTPKGKPPLATAEGWLKVTCPTCGKDAKRDAETLDTFFDSSWYYYRYLDPNFTNAPFDAELAKKLMPVSIYFGGAEHTLGHTLYARFFTKFFQEIGLVDFSEFAKKRVQHGVILGPDGYRMSKSRGNVVNPDDVVKQYGADTVRLYLCFMMPYDATAPWNPGAISGIYRFLKRIWQLYDKVADTVLEREDIVQMGKTVKKVGEDLADIKFNTAVSALMEWLNYLSRQELVSKQEFETMVLLLAPFAPHIAEELWMKLGRSGSVHAQSWPTFDSKLIQDDTIILAVQVNGKLRATINIERGMSNDQGKIVELALQEGKVASFTDSGKKIKKTIYVSGKILNFVVAE